MLRDLLRFLEFGTVGADYGEHPMRHANTLSIG